MKNQYKVLAGFALATVMAVATRAQQLTLDQAIELGVKNSKSLVIDQTQIRQATASYLEARSRQLPSLQVSGTALALANANVDIKAVQSAQGNGATPQAHSAMYGNVTASVPLYAGGRLRYGIQSADYLITAAELSTENDKLAVVYNVAQAYNNLYKANSHVEVLSKNLHASEERDAAFQRLETNGIIARNDKLKANLQTSNIELQLLDARNNLAIAEINMKLLLGFPQDHSIEVDSDYINAMEDDLPATYFVDQAFANRSDLQSIRYQQKATELQLKAAKAQNLPTVALTGGYIAANIPNILTVTNAANIGVGIQYNIDSLWKKNTATINAEANADKLAATRELLNDQIRLEVNRDYQNAAFARKKISVYQKAADQANENYRVTKNKYDNGLATITELLDADAAQISTNVNVLNAKADAALAYRKLLQSSGIQNVNKH